MWICLHRGSISCFVPVAHFQKEWKPGARCVRIQLWDGLGMHMYLFSNSYTPKRSHNWTYTICFPSFPFFLKVGYYFIVLCCSHWWHKTSVQGFFLFPKNEKVLFWIWCELFAQWGLISNEKSAGNHNVNTVETWCSKANNLVKTFSSDIGKVIIRKTKNDWDSLQIETSDD